MRLDAIVFWARLLREYGIPSPDGSWQYRSAYWFGLTLSALLQAAVLALLIRWLFSLL